MSRTPGNKFITFLVLRQSHEALVQVDTMDAHSLQLERQGAKWRLCFLLKFVYSG